MGKYRNFLGIMEAECRVSG